MTNGFAVSVFLSACLLFLVEPMVAKMGLPRFGGGPAVWTTCLLFFQLVLLGGYAYAHWLGSRVRPQRQLLVQSVLLLGALATLPPAMAAPPSSSWPVPQILLELVRSIGLPFFVLSTSSSLLQRWYAMSSRQDPYFLYAASNAGSLLALTTYPLLVEPLVGLRLQGVGFTIGYLLYAALTLGAMWAIRHRMPDHLDVAPSTTQRISRSRRSSWVFRSAVASMLLYSVSLRISTDLPSMPLLWVAPLALYLVSFILAFWPALSFPRERLALYAAAGIVIELGLMPSGPFALVLGGALGTLFVGSWLCHGDLARDRPPPEQLTDFYLSIAAGSALGGLFAGILAPLVFNGLAEYPLALAGLAAVAAAGADRGAALRRALRTPASYAVPAVMAAVLGGAGWWSRSDSSRMPAVLPIGLLTVALVLRRLPAVFPLTSGLVTLAFLVGWRHYDGTLLEQRRSFFGMVRVFRSNDERRMVHGTTLHGIQKVDPPSDLPGTYYHPASPMGAAVRGQEAGARIAVVGLGTGSLAALLRGGQHLTYYEIDPVVESLARRWFTFLQRSAGSVDVVHGDARLTLRDVSSGSLDLLILDAFASDAVPIHLLTVEALQLYLDKLAPDGQLLLHITNRFLHLERVVRAAAARLDVAVVARWYTPSREESAQGAEQSLVVALARHRGALARLGASWTALPPGSSALWTDDRSSLFGVLRSPLEPR